MHLHLLPAFPSTTVLMLQQVEPSTMPSTTASVTWQPSRTGAGWHLKRMSQEATWQGLRLTARHTNVWQRCLNSFFGPWQAADLRHCFGLNYCDIWLQCMPLGVLLHCC